MYYQTIVTIHIIFAGIWLINFIADIVLKSFINQEQNVDKKINNIKIYMKLVNLFGMIGASGILVTGIVITLLNSAYSFFEFSSNHWLVTKQIIMVFILIILFVKLIPTAKGLRLSLNEEGNSEYEFLLKKLFKQTSSINILVILNLLLALSHRYM
ncbi:MAG: hypothetical protein PVH88_07640 [Ignavibacteria bacterium]|jgi:hypothetical protein